MGIGFGNVKNSMYSNFRLFSHLLYALLLPIITLLPQGAYSQKNTPVAVYGLVKNAAGKPLEAATITITSIVPVTQGKADTVALAGITNKQGEFNLKITPSANMQLTISLVGYETLYEPLIWLTGSASIQAGLFTLTETANQLQNVVVSAKKPFMQLAVDRRIFNADAVITAKGGTAIDLMRNIPGLSVDVNGSVQLRNASPIIFVDGRPTMLTLEQIPSDDIEKVEVITNPSSKYDAGSTAGIINVILKKNRRNGLNGTASLGVGAPKVLNGNLSVNYRQGKLNFFVSGNYNRGGGLANSEANQINKRNGEVISLFDQQTQTDRTRRFLSARVGLDYFMDSYNTLSISQGVTDGSFMSIENQQQYYYNPAGLLTQTGSRLADDRYGFNRHSTQVNYRRTYAKPGKEWTADFTYNAGNNSGRGDIFNQLFNPNGQPTNPSNLVQNFAIGSGEQFTLQTDYVNPINEHSKLEAGARFYQNNSKDRLDVFGVLNGSSTKLPLSNNYSFTENINAAYINYSNKLGSKWKYQGGLRFEQSSFTGTLIDSAYSFGYKYPGKGNSLFNALFPSLYLTHQLKEGHDLQFNFTRRIRRPNFWQINPYVDITDPQNLRRGNPQLQPEFTNSFEANYNRVYAKGNFLASAYFRNNTKDITQYTDTISSALLAQLDNAAIAPTALLTTFINANRTNRMGLELTWQHKFNNQFDITPNFNVQYRDVKATIGNLNLNNTGLNWSTRLTTNYKIAAPNHKLWHNLGFQLQGEYESPRVIPQGRIKSMYGFDFAIRKDFLKNNAGTLVFNVQDVLNSRVRGSITDTENFYQDAFRRWNVRSFRLTFSYRFGNNQLQLFNKRREGGGEDHDGGDGGAR